MIQGIFNRNASPDRQDAWQEFANNEELINTHRVTSEELEALRTITLLGTVNGSKELLWILNQLRFARTQR